MTTKSMNRAARLGKPAQGIETTMLDDQAIEQAEGPEAQTTGPARNYGRDESAALFPITLPPRQTKTVALRLSLQEPGGATLASLMETTGWQAHTVRAALSGLRKKGWAVTRKDEGAESVCLIDPAAPIPDDDTDVVRVLNDPVEGGPEQDGAAPNGADI